MIFQTRSEKTGLDYFRNMRDAMNAAFYDRSIWKISFDAKNGDRIRLVRINDSNNWMYEELLTDKDLKQPARR